MLTTLTVRTVAGPLADAVGSRLLIMAANVGGIPVMIGADSRHHGGRVFSPDPACPPDDLRAFRKEMEEGAGVAEGRVAEFLRSVLNPAPADRYLPPLDACALMLADLMEEALETHIYDTANGDLIEADCGYVRAVDRVRAAVAMHHHRSNGLMEFIKGLGEVYQGPAPEALTDAVHAIAQGEAGESMRNLPVNDPRPTDEESKA